VSEKPKSQSPDATTVPTNEVESFLFPSLEGTFAAEKDHSLNPRQWTADNVGQYGLNASARLYQSHYDDPWSKEELKDKGEPLYASFGGRVAIRTFSRGVMGVAGMMAGDLIMRDYDPQFLRKAREMAKEGNTAAWENAGWAHKGVDYLVRGIDATIKPLIQEGIARPIASLRGMEAEQAEDFVRSSTRFRTKVNCSANALAEAREVMQDYYKTPTGEKRVYHEDTYRDWLKNLPAEKKDKLDIRKLNGRDLGHEIVDVSLGFSLMSTMDALGRNIVGVLDPNVKKDWKNEDGSIDAKKLGESVLKSGIDIATYRQAEDWAAALPYVYTMRALRNNYSKTKENSKFTIDNNTGSTFVVNGKTGEIAGDTLKDSALNFQSRFMFYNFYTSMYRDSYQHVAHKIHDMESKEQSAAESFKFKMPTAEDVLSTAREAVDYTAVSFVKSMTWMAPAVPFFWAPRMAMSRTNSRAIYNDLPLENGEMGSGVVTTTPATPIIVTGANGESSTQAYGKDGTAALPKHEREFYATPDMVSTRGAPSKYIADVADGVKNLGKDAGWYAQPYSNYLSDPSKAYTQRLPAYAGQKELVGSELTTNFDALYSRKSDSYMNFIINPIAKVGRDLTNLLDKGVMQPLVSVLPKESPIVSNYLANTRDISQRLVGNSLSYTGYVIAKYETETHINNAASDASLHLAMDGVWTGSLSKIKTGLTDYVNVITKHPISEQTYEKMYEGRGLVNAKQHEKDLAHNAAHGVDLPTTAQTAQRHREIGHKPTIELHRSIPSVQSQADDAIARAQQSSAATVLDAKNITHAGVVQAKDMVSDKSVQHSKKIADELIRRSKESASMDTHHAAEGNKLYTDRLAQERGDNTRKSSQQSWKDAQLQRAAQDMGQQVPSGATIH